LTKRAAQAARFFYDLSTYSRLAVIGNRPANNRNSRLCEEAKPTKQSVRITRLLCCARNDDGTKKGQPFGLPFLFGGDGWNGLGPAARQSLGIISKCGSSILLAALRARFARLSHGFAVLE